MDVGQLTVVNRFRVRVDERIEFRAQVDEVLASWRRRPGLLAHDLGLNLDDPELWVLISTWVNVGAYRRALGGTEAKLAVVPLLTRVIDEPSAFADPDEVGLNRPRGH